MEFVTSPFGVTAFFGVLSGLLSALAFLPYIRDTLRGASQPLRSSWLIWSVLASISFASQVAEGAGASLWFAGTQTAGTVAVMLLSIRRGTGSYLRGSDGLVLLGAAVGLWLWAVTDAPAWALVISISISLMAGSVTVRKAYERPQTETLATWVLSLAGACCAIASVGTLTPALLAYPVYLLLLNGAIVLAILMGRARDWLWRAPLPAPAVFSAVPQPVRRHRVSVVWRADELTVPLRPLPQDAA